MNERSAAETAAEAICQADDRRRSNWNVAGEANRDRYRRIAQAAIDALHLTSEWSNAYEKQWGEDGTWHEYRTGAFTDRGAAEMNLGLNTASPVPWLRNMRVESRLVSPWTEVTQIRRALRRRGGRQV